MSVKVKYKGEQILSLNTDTEKALSTMGQYCEDDITIENVQDGGITPTGSITLTEERSYDVTDKATAVVDMSATRANLAEAVTAKGVDTLPTSSFDTIATNIGLISGGGGLPSSISKIDGGTLNFTTDAACRLTVVNHSLGVKPKGVMIWSDEAASDATPYSAECLMFMSIFGVGWTATVGGTLNDNYSYTMSRKANSSAVNETHKNNNVLTANTWQTSTNSYWYYKANTTYKWIAWA